MEADQNGGLLGFIPLLLLWVTAAFFTMIIAKRKGRSIWIGLVISFPLLMLPGLAWLVSLPDKEMLDRIRSIETLLAKNSASRLVGEYQDDLQS